MICIYVLTSHSLRAVMLCIKTCITKVESVTSTTRTEGNCSNSCLSMCLHDSISGPLIIVTILERPVGKLMKN